MKNIVSLSRTFGLTLQEGAEAARCDGCPEDLYNQTAQASNYTSSMNTTPNYIYPLFSSVLFIAAIILAMSFVKNATKSIGRKEGFNGVGWGLANGICGLGFIFAIAAIVSVHNEIKQVKDKKYVKYAKGQLNQFVITYVLCCVVWFAIGFAIGFFKVQL